jgi:predicted DNA-binding protein (MmcQ/YjbR family)
MNVEEIQSICLEFPKTTQEIKWEHDLCFSVGGKMYCVINLNFPNEISFKVEENVFAELIESNDVIPAPYLARYQWVQVKNLERFKISEWQFYLKNSYELIKNKLAKKIKVELGLLEN